MTPRWNLRRANRSCGLAGEVVVTEDHLVLRVVILVREDADLDEELDRSLEGFVLELDREGILSVANDLALGQLRRRPLEDLASERADDLAAPGLGRHRLLVL